MTARFSAASWRKRLNRLQAGPPLALALFFATIFIIFYVAILANTPIGVRSINVHDDALYMSLGRYLAHGHWLGPFNQFTLMKGPGYPLFLAVAHRLHMSVSLAHALFHCAAIIFFVAVCQRFMRSPWLCAILFMMLLWYPLKFTQPLLLVLRDVIYYGQVLIFVAAFAYGLLGANGRKEKLIYGAISGAFLGWLWLTREEGAWLLPAVGLMSAVAIVLAYRAGNLAQTAATLMLAAGTFGAVQIGFQAANWRAYGKFVGVDVKESNFQRALKALGSVESGGVRPFIPVTRAARERIYAVSPAFASLRGYFEGSGGKGWTDLGCWAQPNTCGEVGAALFLWSLRDAAERTGQYASPQAASAFFGRIADEVSLACERRALVCSPPLIAEMPHVEREQLLQIPKLYLRALGMLVLRPPFPIEAEQSSGNAQSLDASLEFLHRPLHTPSPDVPPGLTLLGWYHRLGNDWFSARVRSPAGVEVPGDFRRLESPDIVRALHDDGAAAQRFSLKADCGGECILELSTPDGARMTIGSSRLPSGSTFTLGRGTLHFDSAHNEVPATVAWRSAAAARIRGAVAEWYGTFLIPLLLLGVVAFVDANLRYFRAALSNSCFVMALVLWVLVLARVTLLVLITATSFHALLWIYLAPACFLTVGAAVLSAAAWLQLAGGAKSGAAGPG